MIFFGGFSPWPGVWVSFKPVERQKQHGGRVRPRKADHLVAVRKQRK
jgi:hypothetical protein